MAMTFIAQEKYVDCGCLIPRCSRGCLRIRETKEQVAEHSTMKEIKWLKWARQVIRMRTRSMQILYAKYQEKIRLSEWAVDVMIMAIFIMRLKVDVWIRLITISSFCEPGIVPTNSVKFTVFYLSKERLRPSQ
jgi:hypothetical protein